MGCPAQGGWHEPGRFFSLRRSAGVARRSGAAMLDATSSARSVGRIDAPVQAMPSASFGTVLMPRRRLVGAAVQQLLRQQSLRWYAALAALELLLLALAPWLAVETRFYGDPEALAVARAALPVQATAFAGVVWLTMLALGLYQRHRRDIRGAAPGTMARLTLAIAVGAMALMVVYFVLPETQVGRGVLGLSLAFGALFLLLSRMTCWRFVGDLRLKRRALFLGAGLNVAKVLRRMRREQDMRSAAIVGFVPMPGDRVSVAESQLLRPQRDLSRFAFESGVDEIVVGTDDRRGVLPMAELITCRLAGIDVLDLDQFCERETGKVSLELVSPCSFVFAHGFNGSMLRRCGKRAFDIGSASVLLLLSWPVMLLVALAIWIEAGGRGPVLYRQERVGENDATFRLVKFRSMRTDAERGGARWAKVDDDRVTRVGRVIRKIRLDELPQLWNVLRGEMSIVGPRPERPEFVEGFKQRIPYYGLRHSVPPGLTGWAQLRYPYGASELDAIEKLRFDLFYVKNHGFQFDLMVLLQTVEVVLFGRGGR
jgi:sugar transferase (PEP-CTERM system associated)